MKYLAPLFLLVATLITQDCGAEISVTDDIGRTITLEKPAQRVIALAPHIVENLFAAGAGSTLIGSVSYSDYPAAAKDIPEVGTYNAFSKETIVAMQPDLVIVWVSGNGMQTLQQLENLGLKVFADDPHTIDDVGSSLRRFGALTGFAEEGRRVAAHFSERTETLSKRYKHAEIISVFYQVWNKPLQTLNDEHLVSDIMRLCGGRNIFADSVALAPKINVESVLQRNPDVIIASGAGKERPEWLEEWKAWPQLTAVQQKQLFFIPADYLQRHTPRILIGARRMCQQLDSVRASKR